MDLKKPSNIIYLSVICVSVLLIVILSVSYFKSEKSSSTTDTAESHVPELRPKETVHVTVNIDTLEDGLNNMGTLITQEYYFTQVESYTKEKKLFNLIPSESVISYSYDGSVTAGINFEDITITKDDEAKTLTVQMPPSEIQTVNIDKSSFKVYSEKESLWNPIKMEDFNNSLSEFESTATKKALDSGILRKSNEQARLLITNFIKNFPTVSEYEIVFDQEKQ